MYIQLMHRHYGVHTPMKHIEIPCKFENVYIGDNNINEELLVNSIPADWLPTLPKNILLTVADRWGTTGQSKLSVFRPWSKYFDSYVLELHKEPLSCWNKN